MVDEQEPSALEDPLTPSGMPLILERPDLQTFAQRWGYRSVTVICWIVWLYLFVPLLSALAWFVGLSFIYSVLIQNLELAEFWEVLYIYALGIGCLTGIYLLWAFYNYLRFRGATRRQFSAPSDDERMAAVHGLSLNELVRLRETDNLTLSETELEGMFSAASNEERASQELSQSP